MNPENSPAPIIITSENITRFPDRLQNNQVNPTSGNLAACRDIIKKREEPDQIGKLREIVWKRINGVVPPIINLGSKPHPMRAVHTICKKIDELLENIVNVEVKISDNHPDDGPLEAIQVEIKPTEIESEEKDRIVELANRLLEFEEGMEAGISFEQMEKMGEFWEKKGDENFLFRDTSDILQLLEQHRSELKKHGISSFSNSEASIHFYVYDELFGEELPREMIVPVINQVFQRQTQLRRIGKVGIGIAAFVLVSLVALGLRSIFNRLEIAPVEESSDKELLEKVQLAENYFKDFISNYAERLADPQKRKSWALSDSELIVQPVFSFSPFQLKPPLLIIPEKKEDERSRSRGTRNLTSNVVQENFLTLVSGNLFRAFQFINRSSGIYRIESFGPCESDLFIWEGDKKGKYVACFLPDAL